MQLLWYLGLFFGYVAVAVVVTVLLVKIVGGARPRKTIVGLLSAVTFLLIPTWDMIPGQRYFKHLCETEAGIRIYKAVERVEGFREYSGGPGDDAVMKYGYRFIETERPGIGLLRISLGQDGQIIKQPISEAISRYAVRETREDLDWNVEKVQRVIIDEHTRERLGIFNIFYYSGNWLQAKLYWAGYAPCGDDIQFYNDFYTSVLKPISGSR